MVFFPLYLDMKLTSNNNRISILAMNIRCWTWVTSLRLFFPLLCVQFAKSSDLIQWLQNAKSFYLMKSIGAPCAYSLKWIRLLLIAGISRNGALWWKGNHIHTAHIENQEYFQFKTLMFIDVSLILINHLLFHRVESWIFVFGVGEKNMC